MTTKQADALRVLAAGEAFATVVAKTGLPLVEVEILARRHGITDPGVAGDGPTTPVRVVGRAPTPPPPPARPKQPTPRPPTTAAEPADGPVAAMAGQLDRISDGLREVLDRSDLPAKVRTRLTRALSNVAQAVAVLEDTAATLSLRAEVADLEAQLAAARTRLRAAAPKKTTGARSAALTDGLPSPRELRAWAAGQGLTVPAAGRVPRTIIDAYRAAHNVPTGEGAL